MLTIVNPESKNINIRGFDCEIYNFIWIMKVDFDNKKVLKTQNYPISIGNPALRFNGVTKKGVRKPSYINLFYDEFKL